MLQAIKDRFLTYYNNELRYLRHSGQNFAQQYPKIARRLELGSSVSPDPHTERLIESFAFMTAKISQEIDDRFPELAATLLNVLFPHLVNPLPAMTIAQLQPDLSKVKQTVGYPFKKGTSLFTYTNEGVVCRFQTVYPVTLWPISVESADFVLKEAYLLDELSEKVAETWFLRIRLKVEGGLSWGDLNPEELVFHLNGEKVITLALYELLMAKTYPQVFTSTDQKKAQALPLGSLQPVGFHQEETATPSATQTTHAYQLLQEYFHLPEKFLFFKIQGLNKAAQINPNAKEIDFLFPCQNVEGFLQQNVEAKHFLLGCSPVVNLFPKTTDPLRITRRKVDYRLLPDQRRDKTIEIYSIQKVIATVEGENTSKTLTPYFSFNHENTHGDDTIYWLMKRIPAADKNLPGTDIQLSFVDLKFNPVLPAQHIVYAETLCTNRFLTDQLPHNAELQLENTAPITSIKCLDKPVSQVYSPTDGESLWYLISQLSVNYLGLMGEKPLDVLKQTLKLHTATTYKNHAQEIDEIVGLETKKITRRFGQEAWRGFAEGVEINLTVKPSTQTGRACFLLASVLRHYLALNVGLNSFIEMVLKVNQKNNLNNSMNTEEWVRWQLLPGVRTPL